MHIARMAGACAVLGVAVLGSAASAFAALDAPQTRQAAVAAVADPSTSPGPSDPPTSPGPSEPPTSPGPSEPPGDFEFGFDKVTLSTDVVEPGGELTMTVICPTSVTAKSNGFVADPEFTEADEESFTGTAEFKQTLPTVVTLTITCVDHGSVFFSTEPGGKTVKPGGQTGKIPVGAPDTGDGSTAPQQDPLALIAGGSVLAVALAGLGAGAGVMAVRRRSTRQERAE